MGFRGAVKTNERSLLTWAGMGRQAFWAEPILFEHVLPSRLGRGDAAVDGGKGLRSRRVAAGLLHVDVNQLAIRAAEVFGAVRRDAGGCPRVTGLDGIVDRSHSGPVIAQIAVGEI